MLTIDEIKEAILALSDAEFVALKKWLSELEAERRWEEWDAQIKADSEAGRLDFLIAEARALKGSGWEGDLDLMRTDHLQAD